MKTAVAVDVREWIYDLTKDEKIGPQSKGKKSKQNDEDGEVETETKSTPAYGKANGNFDRILTEEVYVALSPTSALTLPAGTGVTVFRKLNRADRGGWVPLPDAMLAVLFIKDNGVRTIEQITIRTGGRVVRRRF